MPKITITIDVPDGAVVEVAGLGTAELVAT